MRARRDGKPEIQERKSKVKKLVVTGMLVALAPLANAKVEMAAPFADNMVLQRERAVPVWGKADPGERVTVTFAGQTKRAVAGADGAWRVSLDPLAASKERRRLVAEGAGNKVSIGNVVVGEVWFASGQSNMECPIWGPNPRYRDAKGGIMTQMVRRPFIRYVKNKRSWKTAPDLTLEAKWLELTPENLREVQFSAVAFYYALELYGALDIPVGIIDSSWGGSNIDAWTPPCGYEGKDGLKDLAAYKPTVDPAKSCRKSMHQQPNVMWNGMVAAYAPFAFRGMIWYQGCSNAGEAWRYCEKMHAMFDGWKKEFENPGMKIYFAQLAPYKNNWFELQKAQSKFAKEEPAAALSVLCDAGNLHDIHPADKQIVAQRLALHALKRDYGFSNIIDDSPVLENWRIEDGKFVLSFANAKRWYFYNDDYSMRIDGFEIAGPDGKFAPAKVMNEKADNKGNLKGAELVVAADGVKKPRMLRYLSQKPWTGALYSFDSGLPLGSFEIDAREVEMERSGAGAAKGDALKLPELQGFTKIATVDIPAGKAYSPACTKKEAAAPVSFSRVAYVLELERKDGTVDWVLAAMDAWTADAAMLGVPHAKGVFFQQKAGNLFVKSNIAGVAGGERGEAIVEFFSSNYSKAAGLASAPGSSDVYDINDTATARDNQGYGCLQIHDAAAGKPVFAYNRFNAAPCDVGIGANAAGENPDWTFMHNADLFKSRTLTIFVR